MARYTTDLERNYTREFDITRCIILLCINEDRIYHVLCFVKIEFVICDNRICYNLSNLG